MKIILLKKYQVMDTSKKLKNSILYMFDMVNIPGLDGTATNQKLFSHVTVNESGTDWLIMTTRDIADSVQIYRTVNDQD